MSDLHPNTPPTPIVPHDLNILESAPADSILSKRQNKPFMITKALLVSTLACAAAAIASAQTNTFPASGNVGVGTTAPQTDLHISNATPVIMLQNSEHEDTSDLFYGWIGGFDKSGDQTWWLGEGSSGNKLVGFYADRPDYKLNIFNQGNGISIIGGGNVGIGTTSPQARLHITGTNGATAEGARLEGSNPLIRFVDTSNGSDFLLFNNDNQLRFSHATGAWPQNYMVLSSSGNLGLGTPDPSHKLSVNGAIRAKEVIVESDWSDFVFEVGYALKPLHEVESHIQAHGHLPDVPSAAAVESDGLSLGQAQKIMMQKIEELTLYAIAQEKRIRELEARLADRGE